jgi:thiol-disulfide isomerase/thioredoxin
VNTEAPAFSLTGLDGIPVSLDVLRAFGKPLMLLFTETGCSACEAILPDVARWQAEHADRMIIVPIGRGDLQVNKAKAMRHGLENVLLQENREVAEAYKVQGTPSAVLIKDGLIASPLAAGPDAIRDLVFRTTLPSPVKKGDAAPSLQLRDLDGTAIDVAASSGRKRVLLFWNPSCGFCKAMLKDLKSWERTRSRTAPELVVVSTGSAESNREQGFKSRVLLDPVFGVGQVFGATGTPSSVTLDEHGIVASDVGVGAPAVLAMLGVENPVPA